MDGWDLSQTTTNTRAPLAVLMNARRDIGAEAVELAVFWENMCVPIIALPHLMAESYPVRSVLI